MDYYDDATTILDELDIELKPTDEELADDIREHLVD